VVGDRAAPSNVPIPDPSTLTTLSLEQLRADLITYVDGQFAILNERLIGMHIAPTEGATREVAHLKELVMGMFGSVDQRFAERDVRAEREARDNKTAVDAAFAAQKEAVVEQNKSSALAISKSEAATSEAITKLGEAAAASRNALGDKIDAVKETVATVERNLAARISTAETMLNGVIQNRQGGQQATAGTYALGLLVIAIIGLVITLATKLK
jgi:hypothetical protein